MNDAEPHAKHPALACSDGVLARRPQLLGRATGVLHGDPHPPGWATIPGALAVAPLQSQIRRMAKIAQGTLRVPDSRPGAPGPQLVVTQPGAFRNGDRADVFWPGGAGYISAPSTKARR